MKNKILLTLVLLIPSLCFGIETERINLSVHIKRIISLKDRIVQVQLSSSLISESVNWTFQTDKYGKIPQSEIKRNADMLKWARDFFPKGSDKHLEYTKKTFVDPMRIIHNFKHLAVLNGYALTFSEKTSDEQFMKDFGGYDEIYLHKVVK
jgi:hypothetical protein